MGNNYGFVKDGKVFRKAFLDFEEREIGEVRDNEQDAFQYFEDRFQSAKKSVEEVVQKIDSTENKGSYLMKILHLKETLPQFDGLGDFESLFSTLDKYENLLNDIINKNRLKNLEIKKALLEEAKPYQQGGDWKKSTEELLDIKKRWVKTGAIPKENDDLEEEFKELLNKFFERKSSFFEEKKLMYESRKKGYEEVIEGLLKLIDDPQLFKKGKEIATLKRQWRAQESVPKAIFEDLKPKYLEALKKVEAKLVSEKDKIKEGSKEKNKGNLKVRNSLLQELIELESTKYDANQLKDILNKWKKAGPVAKSDFIKLNKEFYDLYDKLREKLFIENLLTSKHKSFDKKPVSEQLKLKVNLIYELIARHKQELSNAEENAEKFNSKSSGFNELIQSKLEKLKKQLANKQILLEESKKFLSTKKK